MKYNNTHRHQYISFLHFQLPLKYLYAVHFFSLPFNQIVRKCGEDDMDRWSRAYTDDVNACDKVEKVIHYFEKVAENAPTIGLNVNLGNAVSGGRTCGSSTRQAFPWFPGLRLLNSWAPPSDLTSS